MTKEDYCSYEVAKLLKEKGFDWPCHYSWHGGIQIPTFHRKSKNFNGDEYKNLSTEWYSAPTHQMAMRWLREIKDIDIVIIPFCGRDGKFYYYEIHSDDIDVRIGRFAQFEKAVEAALKYVLKNPT